jgi:LytS/YehU family sensor histidine kinase
MGLGLWALTGRYRWPAGRLRFFGVAHIGLAVLFAVAWAAWMLLVAGGDPVRMPRSILTYAVLPWHLVMGVMLYGLIAGSSYAARAALSSRDLRIAAERAERLRAESDLAALRAHVNPHFLFNTLHSVSELLRTDPDTAVKAIERLANVFRYAVRLDRDRRATVSLEEEWRFAETYLCLEALRMGNRLRVDAVLDDEALACAIPPFTLQPLVENAIRHGLGPKPAGGTITVNAAETDGHLTITVADDGVGAEPDTLESSAGLGIRSVRKRLDAEYGGRTSLDVACARGRGVAVTVRVPAIAAR